MKSNDSELTGGCRVKKLINLAKIEKTGYSSKDLVDLKLKNKPT
jgi:hypothetical protein